MAQFEESNQGFWGEFHGPNMGYVEEQYDLYKEDPESVDPSIKEMFDQYGAPTWLHQSNHGQSMHRETSINDVKTLTSAMKFVEAIRRFGHLDADIYPVGLKKK